MGHPFGFEMAKARQRELLREAEGRRMAGVLRKARRGEDGRGPLRRMLSG